MIPDGCDTGYGMGVTGCCGRRRGAKGGVDRCGRRCGWKMEGSETGCGLVWAGEWMEDGGGRGCVEGARLGGPVWMGVWMESGGSETGREQRCGRGVDGSGKGARLGVVEDGGERDWVWSGVGRGRWRGARLGG